LLVAVFTHASPQGVSSPAQSHWPATQVCAVPQALPQTPQFFASV
jgi:hypothetical protein